jgi:hypothetical protein
MRTLELRNASTPRRLSLELFIFVTLSLASLIASPAIAQNLQKAAEKKETEVPNPYLAYRQKQRIEVKELENCSWLVSYRNRIYDLSPLSRKGLERPLEGDLHSILRRVPLAAESLQKIERNNQEAKVHTAIASFAILTIVGTRIAQGSSERRKRSDAYLALNIGAGLLFLRSVYAGFETRRNTREELVNAVQEFNKVSEDPILPYEGDLK